MKRDRFRRGLNTKLRERLNLVRPDSFNELVNLAITQDDCIAAHRAKKKWDNRCFTCGSPAHFARNCPRNQKPAQGQNSNQNNQGKGKKQVMQVRQGKINFTTLAELPEGAPIMTGTFSIHHKPAIILFDYGATHSFISAKCGGMTRIGF